MTDRSPAERQSLIRSIVIEHDRFSETVDAIGRFHMPVRGGLHSVGCLSAVIGDSRAGKSFAADRYSRRFPAVIGPAGMETPVLYVDMPMKGAGGPRAILECLAQALELPVTGRMNNPTIIANIQTAIVNRRVQHLILDEWDQVFRQSSPALLGFARGLLRKILNLRTASVTCIGLHATYELLRADEQLLGRGGLPHHVVRPYRWGNVEERGAFRLLCDCFDQQLPFNERAGLGRTGFAERLAWWSEGNIGRLKVIIEAASALAINDGSSRVDLHHFADAYDERKAPGTPFNPFQHEMSRAPKNREKAHGKVAVSTPPQAFSKQRAREFVLEARDAI